MKEDFSMLWRALVWKNGSSMLWRALVSKKISQCYAGLLYERKFLNVMEGPCMKEDFSILWRALVSIKKFSMLWRALVWKKISQCYGGRLYERRFLNVMEGPWMKEDFSMLWRFHAKKEGFSMLSCRTHVIWSEVFSSWKATSCMKGGFSHHGGWTLVSKEDFISLSRVEIQQQYSSSLIIP